MPLGGRTKAVGPVHGKADLAAERRWQPAAGVLCACEGDHIVLTHVKKGQFFGLSGVGARIWALVNAGASASAIVEKLRLEYDAPPVQLEQDVIGFLDRLSRAGVIDECPPTIGQNTAS